VAIHVILGNEHEPGYRRLVRTPEWQKPLFSALERREVRFGKCDLKKAAFDPDMLPEAPLYFNQASPSAYVRGNTRAVPFCLSLMRSLELGGARVLNGSQAFSLELSKSAQAALMRRLGIAHPRTLAFNDADAALAQWGDAWPALLKPEQGGSGARIVLDADQTILADDSLKNDPLSSEMENDPLVKKEDKKRKDNSV